MSRNELLNWGLLYFLVSAAAAFACFWTVDHAHYGASAMFALVSIQCAIKCAACEIRAGRGE